MLIFFIISFLAIVSVHRFIMRSVDNYGNYGGGSFEEWRMFEKEKLNF